MRYLLFLCLFFFSFIGSTQESKFPDPIGYINDFEGVFTEQQKSKLEKIVFEYEKSTTREIVIITINSIEPYKNINNFATDISNYWGVGKSKKNNGLTILFSKKLREIRISTGTGTALILTDNVCDKVLKEIIIPEFKKENYFIGIEKGVKKLIEKWN